MKANNIITAIEKEVLMNNMKSILSDYDYDYTENALEKIIDTWSESKASLIQMFKKHPNYIDGKFMIAFSANYTREKDEVAITNFMNWVDNYFVKKTIEDVTGKEIGILLATTLIRAVHNSTHILSDCAVSMLNSNLSSDLKFASGQKTSRAINKILTYYGYNKHPQYNKEFAKFADAINPLTITRHTVLSINPMDYLTMSFGNSWASCHTIDKHNIRRMPNSYEGMYSSGTISYMLDGTSMVLYTVDEKYDGTDFFTQPKINRQMFHYGEDKIIQGRLYPQSNDGNGDVYKPYREIVQNIISTISEVPNFWSVSKGTDNASRYIISKGTHYCDYIHFSNCTLSVLKGIENTNSITVGHNPICVECGSEHGTEDNINCCTSNYYCSDCGDRIDNASDIIWVDDEPYCRDCVEYCECCEEYHRSESTYVRNYGNVCDDCLREYFSYCNECYEYVHNNYITWVDSEGAYMCDDCFNEHYSPCEECGEYFHNGNMTNIRGNMYCCDCASEFVFDDEEEAAN